MGLASPLRMHSMESLPLNGHSYCSFVYRSPPIPKSKSIPLDLKFLLKVDDGLTHHTIESGKYTFRLILNYDNNPSLFYESKFITDLDDAWEILKSVKKLKVREIAKIITYLYCGHKEKYVDKSYLKTDQSIIFWIRLKKNYTRITLPLDSNEVVCTGYLKQADFDEFLSLKRAKT